ncbi:MAG: hemerythrin domain-containing protein [Azoarcus sp.]|jgi:branched-chain amino acid transport system ATP-binding protein|nr:hemerythrin domain-containing protein [Azoarcus sp.]MDX9836333.1 hemerythrin domain-containing protein [Azoarcus sp.]
MTAMQQAIEIIKDEHRSMGAVLKGLQAHVDAVREGRDKPDFPLFQTMFDYIETIPDRVHHPKEDEYLFKLLRLRSHAADTILDELEGQHHLCASLLESVRKAMAAYRESGDIAGFERSLNAYAEFLWEHMRKEEEVVMPLAEQHLAAEDWEAIHAAFQANRSHAW